MRISKLCTILTAACFLLSAVAAGGVNAQTSGNAPADQEEFESRVSGERYSVATPALDDFFREYDISDGRVFFSFRRGTFEIRVEGNYEGVGHYLTIVYRYTYAWTASNTGRISATVTGDGDSSVPELEAELASYAGHLSSGNLTFDDEFPCEFSIGASRLVQVGVCEVPPDLEEIVFDRTIPRQSYVLDRGIGRVTLPAATGGDGSFVYSISPVLPEGVTFDPSTRTLSGTPTEAMESTTYTYTATDASGEAARLNFTIAVAPLEEPGEEIVFPRIIPRQSYVLNRGIGQVTLPAATGADGSFVYSISPDLPEGVTFDPSTRVLSGTPRELSAPQTYTYAATADGGSASLTFVLSVSVDEPPTITERETVTETVAAVAAATVSNVTANIGSRFAAARSGTGAVVGGVPVSFAKALSEAPARDAHFTLRRDSWTEPGGATRTLELDELIHTSTFQIALGAASEDGEPTGRALQWTLWGRGDLQFFSSDPGDRTGYDGDLKAGYLGADVRLGDRWLAGAALSRTGAQADYEREESADDGHLDVSLTSVHPYVRFAPDAGTEVWSVLGAGAGEIEDERDGAVETTDLTMWMGSAGARRALAPAGPAALALLGDAQFVRVETEDGNEAGVIQGLTVDVWRLRAGVEGSYTSALENGAAVTSFVEIAGRYDGGDGGGETGVEVSPGVYYSDPASGFGLEARARALLLHSGEGYKEHGASVTASLAPGAGGEGLSLSLSPRWGVGGGTGAETLWRDTSLGRTAAGQASAGQMSLDARVGYGLALSRGLLTPFAELGLHEADRRRMRMGVRFSGPGAGALKVELAGERSEGGASDAVHRVGLTAQLRF